MVLITASSQNQSGGASRLEQIERHVIGLMRTVSHLEREVYRRTRVVDTSSKESREAAIVAGMYASGIPVEINSPIPEMTIGERIAKRCTARGLVVLYWIAQGYTNKAIASELRTSEQVIKNYARSLFADVGVENRQAATIAYYQYEELRTAACAAAMHEQEKPKKAPRAK